MTKHENFGGSCVKPRQLNASLSGKNVGGTKNSWAGLSCIVLFDFEK